VLPKYMDSCYIILEVGDTYGDIDLLPSNYEYRNLKREMIRKFTVQAITACEVLVLSIKVSLIMWSNLEML